MITLMRPPRDRPAGRNLKDLKTTLLTGGLTFKFRKKCVRKGRGSVGKWIAACASTPCRFQKHLAVFGSNLFPLASLTNSPTAEPIQPAIGQLDSAESKLMQRPKNAVSCGLRPSFAPRAQSADRNPILSPDTDSGAPVSYNPGKRGQSVRLKSNRNVTHGGRRPEASFSRACEGARHDTPSL